MNNTRIPRIIHYCWFGRGEMPELVQNCIASWHRHMPSLTPNPSPEERGICDRWQYMLWNEDNFDIDSAPAYVQEAYAARKFAFVSDYVRLWALEQYGGLYMDVDFEVYKPFDDLLNFSAFAGYEGSKRMPVMMGVIASEPHGIWVSEMLKAYEGRNFKLVHDAQCTMHNGTPEYDMTTNVEFVTNIMVKNGFKQDGTEQDYKDLHVLPVDYFSPRHTTGEYIKTENTYCEHKGLNSWGEKGGLKAKILNAVSPRMRTKLIKLKRKILG